MTSCISDLTKHSNKGVLMVAFAVIIALLIDMEITNISDIIDKDWLTSYAGIAVFIIVSSVYLVGQLFILNFVEQKSKEMRIRARYFKTINTILRIGCFFLTAILLVVILDVVIESFYYTAALVAITTSSYGLAIIMMGFLMQRFFSWYRSNKDSIVVLLYGLSAETIATYSAAGLVYFDIILLDKPAEIFPDSEVSIQCIIV